MQTTVPDPREQLTECQLLSTVTIAANGPGTKSTYVHIEYVTYSVLFF